MATELKILNFAFRPLSDESEEEVDLGDKEDLDDGDEDLDGAGGTDDDSDKDEEAGDGLAE